MRVLTYVYDADRADETVSTVLDRIEVREESVEVVDVAAFENRAGGIREATLAVKQGVGIGTTSDDLFDDDGNPDFGPGALITEEATGRRSLYVGEDALAALREE